MPYSLVEVSRFSKKRAASTFRAEELVCFLDLLFDPEIWDSTFLRNICKHLADNIVLIPEGNISHCHRRENLRSHIIIIIIIIIIIFLFLILLPLSQLYHGRSFLVGNLSSRKSIQIDHIRT
jgi:hypothetical protein